MSAKFVKWAALAICLAGMDARQLVQHAITGALPREG